MSPFEPISASETILRFVERYLKSNFNPRREPISKDYLRAIEYSKSSGDLGGSLFREVRREFAAGRTIDELISDGIAHPHLANYMKQPPYAHQSKALELSIGKSRNIIVATGTGSGKTESFLMPIIHSLLEERDAGTLTPGIRAIVVYPMNALAADQLDRIRTGLMDFPDLTFGRFVGPTKQTTREAEQTNGGQPFLPNERPSRDAIVENPPHILITNYAMLERLLLLPVWAPLFTGQLKWLVMDEVHSYDGTKGLEIGMLLRRLKIRTASSTGVRCIAASATLGDPTSQTDAERAAEFASNLFGEKFTSSDLIRPEYSTNSLEEQPIDVFALNDKSAIDLLKKENFGAYHLFIRNPGGAFICLNQNHPTTHPRIRLQQRKWCEYCSEQSRLIEIGACRSCGIEYLIAKTVKEELVPVEEFDEAAKYYRLLEVDLPDWEMDQREVRDEEIESDDSDLLQPGPSSKWWCNVCSRVNSSSTCSSCNSICHVETSEPLALDAKGVLRCERCASTGGRSAFGPIMRPVSGVDAITSVIATGLYQELPTDNSGTQIPGSRRKLLAFSDNRQDAAYFAPYLEETYFDLLRRRMIIEAIAMLKNSVVETEQILLKAVTATLAKLWKEAGQEEGDGYWPWAWLRGELLSTDLHLSLSGTGNIKIEVPKSKLPASLKILEDYGLNEIEAWNLVNALLESVAYEGGVELPNGVNANDPIFAPKETVSMLYRVGQRPNGNAFPWISESTIGNKRTSLIERVLKIERSEARAVLEQLWDTLEKDEIFSDEGVGLRTVKMSSWRIIDNLNGVQEQLWCDVCRRPVWWKLSGEVCTTKNCKGNPKPRKLNVENHYKVLQRSMEIASLKSKEHTAQWTAEEAEIVQDEFIGGRVNVLSCSTTFEMGVDIGDVVAVLCRNVPPTPANYVQRAGRAGRRRGDKALIVTFARRRSHDALYAADPLRLIKGRVPVPVVNLENFDLVRRHVYALALSEFFREIGFLGTTAKALFGVADASSVTIAEAFIEWLATKPASLFKQISELDLSQSVIDRVGLKDWTWVNALLDVDEDGKGAWLSEIQAIYSNEIDLLKEWIANLHEDQLAGGTKARQAGNLASGLIRVRNDLESRQMVELLANGGVLPKYGFPVDVASLVPSYVSANNRSKKIELTRDLSLAISEYSPGSQVVAGGNILTSTGVQRPINVTFESLRYVALTCDNCGWFFHTRAPFGIQAQSDLPPTCSNCANPFSAKDRRYFIQPRYGFIAKVDPRSAGSKSRPKRSSSAKTFVSTSSEIDTSWRLVKVGLETSISREAKLLTITSLDYAMCSACGFATPLDSQRGARGRNKHEDPRKERECQNTSQLQRTAFAHEFMTDVLRVRFNANIAEVCVCGEPDCNGPMDSATAALVSASVKVLGISTSDLNTAVSSKGRGLEKRFMIFDTTPGGAGLAKAVSERLSEIINLALEIVSDCKGCPEDSSCYACIRSYSNQRMHEHLSRGQAQRLLRGLMELTN